MIKVQRALISVSDKTGIVDFARGLSSMGVDILSTGGTARLLKQNNIAVKDVSDYTGFPEILDGRVKTLHPKIHGALLALRDKKKHLEELKTHNIETIDMVVVNLYPFERVVRKKNVTIEEALENIDIGGACLLRAAAKNFKNIAVVSNLKRYRDILDELDLNSGLLSDSVLMNLSIEAFACTARYDNIIFEFLQNSRRGGDLSALPSSLVLRFKKSQDLRYGENPHQAAAFYSYDEPLSGLAKMKQRHGKELSYNNILDLQAAVGCVKDFASPAAVIVKHNNPTGIAEAKTLHQAYKDALLGDPVSAFGGIIGLNKKVDLKTAEMIVKSGFMECVIAPGYERSAFKCLSKKKNLRLMELNFKDLQKFRFSFRQVDGGLLLQEKDRKTLNVRELNIVTKRKPSPQQLRSLLFGWKIIKYIRSNAVILVKGTKTVGIGCGQTSRIESTSLAVRKAGKKAKGSVMISEAFLPKTDNVTVAAKAGVAAIMQSGGSIADTDVIKQADKAKIAMVTTGVRHFKH